MPLLFPMVPFSRASWFAELVRLPLSPACRMAISIRVCTHLVSVAIELSPKAHLSHIFLFSFRFRRLLVAPPPSTFSPHRSTLMVIFADPSFLTPALFSLLPPPPAFLFPQRGQVAQGPVEAVGGASLRGLQEAALRDRWPCGMQFFTGKTNMPRNF